MNRTLSVLSHLWQLPQDLAGLVFGLFMKDKRRVRGIPGIPDTVRVLCSPSMSGGISLGHFIYVKRSDDVRIIRHEYGHYRQSRILGPLYLLVIGLPSLFWAVWWHPGRRMSYYHFWPERWADRLAGLERKKG